MGNRTALYLTDRQYADLLKALHDAKTYRREQASQHDNATFYAAHNVAPIASIEREIYEQVIVLIAERCES